MFRRIVIEQQTNKWFCALYGGVILVKFLNLKITGTRPGVTSGQSIAWLNSPFLDLVYRQNRRRDRVPR